MYLVGGAVRDQLLGYPVTERDWVVVGATPEQLLQQGYKRVGRDFPVFLHPVTREEYALARIERKSDVGYYGFVCDYNQHVTLEQDLLRRDLTINAMALDASNNLIDPYNGLYDLKQKILRHVSVAFIEDPVRVLRVARFAARYHHLGFRVAEETQELMAQIVKCGELNHLVPERIWQELHKSLMEKHPEVFFTTLSKCGALSKILPEIDNDRHSSLALTTAVVLSNDPKIRFAVLIYNIQNELLIKNLCKRLRVPASYQQFAILVARYHVQINQVLQLTAVEIMELLNNVDCWRRSQRFMELLIACQAIEQNIKPNNISNMWCKSVEVCLGMTPNMLLIEGYHGAEIKHMLYVQRIAAIEEMLGHVP